MAEKKYDAFLLFNNEERSLVEEIEKRLRQANIEAWLWNRDVPAGSDWESLETRVLDEASTAVAFLGVHGWGPNHRRFTARAVDLQKQIIPVLIGNPPEDAMIEFDELFKRLRRVDFRSGADDDQALRLLVDAIRNHAPVRQPAYPAEQVLYTLIHGNDDQRTELIDQLWATRKTYNHAEVRERIINELGRFGADRSRIEATSALDPNLTPSVRSWMLSALSILSEDDHDSRQILLNHLNPEVETDAGVRYWALAAIYGSRLPQYESEAARIFESETLNKVRTLAAAILYQQNPDARLLLNEQLSKESYSEIHPVLRALRIVPVVELIPDLIALLSNPQLLDAPVAYDTLNALSHPAVRTKAAQELEQTFDPDAIVEKFIDAALGSSRSAINRLSTLLSEMDLSQIRPRLDRAAREAKSTKRKAAKDLIQAIYIQKGGWTSTLVAGSASDSVQAKDEDQLDILNDVRTLCSVLISRQLNPPLAVGLFGDWGTGKTFFMEKMKSEINELIERARKNGWESTFHTQVVQITFNAWHYSDANLWASLVSYIFEELAKAASPAETEQEARARLFKELQTAKELREEAEMARRNAVTQRDETQNQLKDLAEKRAEKEVKIADLKLTDFLAMIESQPALKLELEKTLNDLGLPAAISNLRDLEAAFSEAHSLAGRFRALFLQIAKSKSKYTLLVLLAFTLIALPLLAWGLRAVLPTMPIVTQFVAFVGDVVILLGGILATMKQPIKKANDFLTTLENAHKEVNSLLESKRREKSEEEHNLEKELSGIKADEAAATIRFEEAETKLREIEEKIKEIDEGRSLSRFQMERVRSEDYRKHLGIISSIRKDFENLSTLLPGGTIEAGAMLSPVNRIILFIDDLDRCQTETVVDVLQAVHLLLAFPIFVVVVGVDSRWLLHSLEKKYSAFQDDRGAKTTGIEKGSTWITTPQNYLEKIFQIPFAIRPMPEEGYLKLIKHLIPSTSAVADNLQANKLNEGEPDRQMPKLPPRAIGRAATAVSIPGTPKPVTTPMVPPSTISGSKPALRSPEPVRDLDPRSLEIQSWETEFAEGLYRLIPTPRAAKRFTNVYRISKHRWILCSSRSSKEPRFSLVNFVSPWFCLPVSPAFLERLRN